MFYFKKDEKDYKCKPPSAALLFDLGKNKSNNFSGFN